VRALCERYGQAYNTGPFHRQLASVARRILRHALPGGAPAARPRAVPAAAQRAAA
jgi:hypothetical protein